MSQKTNNYATYIRVSTNKQDTGRESQTGAIQEWLNERDINVDPDDQYADIDRSGSDDSREEFQRLVSAVKDEEYTDIVMPEISRLARKTSTAAEFIDECVERDITIHLLDDMIDVIEPDDPMSQFFAKLISLWMEEDRKQTVRRIRRGVEQAQRQGKWTGRTPTGFVTDDEGYLMVNTEEFLAVQDALKRILEGESKRSVERDTRFTRTTLSNILENRREWYMDIDGNLRAADTEEEVRRRELVQEALDDANIEPVDSIDAEELEERITDAVLMAIEGGDSGDTQ